MKSLNKQNRLHNCPIPIVAITGGIATGKSSILKFLKEKKFTTINADLLVKEIYKHSKTMKMAIENDERNHEYYINENIDFKKLRYRFFNDTELKNQLEEIIYQELPIYFLNSIAEINASLIIYEIPLLFELNLAKKVDFIVLAYASRNEQIHRIKKRDGSSQETIERILSQQLPIEDKVKQADLVIDTTDENRFNQDISGLLLKLSKRLS